MNSRAALHALASFAALLLASCIDQVDPNAPTDPSVDPSLATRQGTPADPNSLARGVPGFGGFFLDAQGAPTVYLKDAGQRGSVERALQPYFRSKGLAAGQLKTRRGDYDWSELERWYSAASAELLGLPGGVYVDADEASNRVRIGFERGAESRIRGALARLKLPESAVILEETEPVRFAVAPKPKPGQQSLQGVVRPIIGGVQINFPGFLCTLGFNARAQGNTNSFITASHCTNVQGGAENTPYWQPTRTASPAQIATEAADPQYSAALNGCPSGRVCRFSDASRATYQSGFSQFTLGRIAKTSRPGRSLTITGGFTVTSESAAIVGNVVNKVGRTTGWSRGNVTNTCVNTNVSGTNITQLCQNFVSATVGSGDSGSPVFIIGSGDDVALVGILWGSSGPNSFVFSPISQVEQELGALTTF